MLLGIRRWWLSSLCSGIAAGERIKARLVDQTLAFGEGRGQTRRLIQRTDGYVATLVSGQIVTREGKATGALPGRLVRGQQPGPAMAEAAE